jgi:hypothetical protein
MSIGNDLVNQDHKHDFACELRIDVSEYTKELCFNEGRIQLSLLSGVKSTNPPALFGLAPPA